MSTWAIIWLSLLGLTGVSFVILLLVVGGGAVAELKQTLQELRDFSEPQD